jgi:uncharacterized cupredoxin-like copper-binding protein
MTRVRGLLCAAAAVASLAGCAPQPSDRVVEITIRHSRFSPAAVDVAAGDRVRFVIRNLDPIDHEFILGDADVQRRHEDGREPHHGLVPGEVSIPAATLRSTTYEFGQPGALVFGCHLPGHWSYGMRGTVRVV